MRLSVISSFKILYRVVLPRPCDLQIIALCFKMRLRLNLALFRPSTVCSNFEEHTILIFANEIQKTVRLKSEEFSLYILENEAARGLFSTTILENEGGVEKDAFSKQRSSTVSPCSHRLCAQFITQINKGIPS